MLKRMVVGILFILATMGMLCAQQSKANRPSPPASAECKLPGGQTIKVDYSSPRMKGRKIYGGLVPYGQVWRTGANEATTFVTGADLVTGTTNIPAGNYTIFTVPNEDKWMLIINKKTGEWGIPYKYESDELARVPMTVSKLSAPVENFTISFTQDPTGCTMHVSWESTEASIPFNVKNTDRPVTP